MEKTGNSMSARINVSSLQSINPLDAERIAGAKDCIAALTKLKHSADNLPPAANYAAAFVAIQSCDAEYLTSLFGPLTPRQEGAFRTLAEYIHSSQSTGEPDLERWLPHVAETPEEIAAGIATSNAEI